MKTGRIVWTHIVAGRDRVLADRSSATPSTSATQGGTVLSLQDPRRPRELDLPRQRRGQGRPGVRRRDTCTSATTPATPTRSTPTTATRCGRSARAAPTSASARATSTRPPAVAFGRVYLGNTDGRVYSFAERTGQLAWATATGAYVYGSPAVAEIPGSRARPCTSAPTTATSTPSTPARARFAGVTRPAAGSLARRRSSATSSTTPTSARRPPPASTSARVSKVFAFSDGAFNPVIADPGAIYMVGYGADLPVASRKTLAADRTTPRPQGQGQAQASSAKPSAVHAASSTSNARRRASQSDPA